MEWQPIETAPKGPGSVLLWVPENECTFMAIWREDHEIGYPAGWCIFGGDWRAYLQGASHWMHRPKPPEARP
jgi:hypothetical protein